MLLFGKFDVISIGSATEDVFVYLPDEYIQSGMCVLKPGSKVEINGMNYFTGGGATNTSVAFSRLGLRAGIICALGEDESAHAVLSELKSEKVDTSLVKKIAGANTAYSVIITAARKDRIVLHYGKTTAMLEGAKINWNGANTKWFYLSSLHSKNGLLEKIATYAKKIGAKIAFNPGQNELALGLEGLLKIFGKIDVLILNSEEALKLTGSADTHRNLQKLRTFAEIVAITEGPLGAHATEGKNAYFAKPYDVPVADVTGAGDAFGAAFCAAIIKGKNVADAIFWGTANASSEVMGMGTKSVLLSERGIAEFAKKYSKKENKVEVSQL